MYALRGVRPKAYWCVWGEEGCQTQKVHTQKKKNIGTKTRLLFVTESKISNLLYLENYLNLMLKYTGITGIK